ncbi:hypothetical protein HYN48_14150 [Flavobacterium magnum]|uniref:Uncharacterized protein n=1 Tax=Flavobacterium magnum TaxID=2162713 RepID=A0A2S0RK93_9FLAO|nr:hypothetical protein [Flavobacterium magnum]AWA31142.1 hypothetical protein HYN48_14150 [Flavobacterium magnum]
MRKFKNLMQQYFKLTPVFVISIFIIVIGIPYGIFGLSQTGGSSLGGVLILCAVAISALVLFFDRLLVSTISSKKLSIAEFIILVVITFFYFYSERKIEIKIDSKTSYFVLIENNGNFVDSNLKYKFPFDKILNTKKKHAVINSISKNYQRINLDIDKSWGSLVMRPEKMQNINIQFYSFGDIDFSQNNIDSLVIKEINLLERK